jgi:hypothetical protein
MDCRKNAGKTSQLNCFKRVTLPETPTSLCLASNLGKTMALQVFINQRFKLKLWEKKP